MSLTSWRMRILGGVALAAASPLLYFAATASPFCAQVPQQYWLSAPEIELRLRDIGLRLKSMTVNENRCYEILADNGKSGAPVTIVMHPVTAAMLSQTPAR